MKEYFKDTLPTHNFTEEEIEYYENVWVDPLQDAYENFCDSVDRELKDVLKEV